MTLNEFKVTCWEFGTEVEYNSQIVRVTDWNYETHTIQLIVGGETVWVECKDVEVVI